MVEHFDMAAGFYIERFFHRGALHQYRHIAVQHIDFLLCIGYHAPCRPNARQTDDHASHDDRHTDNPHQFDFILQVFYDHNLNSYNRCSLFFFYRIIECIAPVTDIFACCATPSPKFLVLNAVSPSGIIHAARSGTRFKHFNATILAAIR